jgi:hypothetical protein
VSEPTKDVPAQDDAAPNGQADAALNGQAQDDETPDLPNPETGVGIGAGAPSTFEPEEDDPQ